jgi:hypothetical protein
MIFGGIKETSSSETKHKIKCDELKLHAAASMSVSSEASAAADGLRSIVTVCLRILRSVANIKHIH